MKRRALTLLLCLTLLLSLAIPGTMAFANATNGDGETPAETPTDSGMVVNKTAEKNADGNYTITLEAYATGAKVISEIKNDVPTDIILVLDQSGSMGNDMGRVTFDLYRDSTDWWDTTYHTRNQDYYNYRHNGGSANLWHKLGEDEYVSVSVVQTTEVIYTPITNGRNNSTTGGATNYWTNRNTLYALVDGEYQKVTVTRSSSGGTYTYRLPDNTTIGQIRGGSGQPTFTGVDGGILYFASSEQVYKYTYTDSDGKVQTIGTSTGSENKPTFGFYERSTSSSGGGTRLSALKSAVSTFASQVATKAAGADGEIGTDDDINHRIAVVGFASQSGYGNNTELLSIRGQNSGSVGVAYNRISNQNLKDVLQSMDTPAGQTMVANAINALTANGATRVDLGMDMASRILDANPVNGDEKRNRVVVVFTDGSPTDNSGFELNVANSAIGTSSTIKNGGATVYSVGIFAGADATSAGSKPSGNLSDNSAQVPAASNWFMQSVSSNNGTPQSPSYYLSAADAGTLSNIFQQISGQIESGGTSSTLTEESVVKDIVSEQFTLPQGATASSITLETYKYMGGDQKAASSWAKNDDAMGAKATVNGDQVSVTGFDFSKNYVGTVTENGNVSYRGHKLVIKFNVAEKEGLLGGNAIPTNASAGVYEKSDSTDPVIRFPQPTVDVPIEDVNVTAEDKNVYLKGTVTAADLQTGAAVKVGDVELDLSKAADTENPYGLEKWQVEYVDIVVKILKADGTEVTDDYKDLTEDTTYTVEVTVSPKNEGAVTAESGKADGNINVFTPTLTYKDSEAYYGETAATDFSANKVSDEWKHGTTKDTDVTMHGTKPNLDIVYTADDSKLDNGKYTKQDVLVAATVKIGGVTVNDQTTFVHQDCTPACDFKATEHPGNPAFKIHIKTCTLKITKQGGAAGETYVFDVYKDNQKYSEVTVFGNNTETLVELPVGTYTIRENAGWSWRYIANNGTAATLSAQTPEGDITCTNTKNVNTWLNGFSAVARNIFGKAN